MSDLQRVVKLAELLQEQQTELKRLEQEAKAVKKIVTSLEREDLPALMNELGLTKFTLTDGSEVKIKEEVDASITKSNPGPALKWLLDNKFGGLIKTEVAMAFGRGDRVVADKVTEELKELGYSPELKEAVHPGTLKAFVKEQMTAGNKIPMDLFNVFPYSKATITRSK